MQADGANAQFALLEQVDLIGAKLFFAQLVRRTTEMPSKILHDLQVRVYGSLRVITTLELFQHHFPKLGHRDLLVTQRLRHAAGIPQATHTRSVRRAGGFVLTA